MVYKHYTNYGDFMTLDEFRKLTTDLPGDTVIFIKGQDEYLPASTYRGFKVREGMVRDGDEFSLVTAEVDGEEEVADMEECGWEVAVAITLDASD